MNKRKMREGRKIFGDVDHQTSISRDDVAA
jgi:hypothetical protein